ncbi:MAG: TOBE domain-containing protein, partial [Roseiarcus sp.]|uniref:TOBE domain-containing protein n=1 Tax=Roseiarcus sp. TaxID=1969460 RepID=UPI003C1A4139
NGAGKFAVRADRVTVVSETANTSRLGAVVTSIEYQGANYTVGLESGPARDLSAILGDAAFANTPLSIGDRIGLAWADEDEHPLLPAS